MPDHLNHLPQIAPAEASTVAAADHIGHFDVIVGEDNFNDVLFGTDGPDKISGLGGDDVLEGGGGDDTLLGGDGSDSLHGQDGNDSLSGGAGDDYLSGGTGADTLNGGAGFDAAYFTFRAQATPVSIDLSGFVADQTVTLTEGPNGATAKLINIETINLAATYGNDTIVGSSSANGIDTGGGNDHVDAGGGNDTIYDYNGDSTLLGGAGDDHIYVSESNPSYGSATGGHDQIDGGTGFDTVTLDWSSTTSSITMTSSAGHILVSTADGDLSADLTNVEAFEIDAGAGGATLSGGSGNDIFNGGYNGANLLSGGDGADRLNGGELADSLDGGAGNDTLFGGQGNDTLIGGDGIDTYVVEAGVYDSVHHGNVFDESAFPVGPGVSVISDNMGGLDTISGFEAVEIWTDPYGNDTAIGTAGDDVIYDSTGTDSLSGGAGNDTIYQTPGNISGGFSDLNDTLDGGPGVDTLSWALAYVADPSVQGWAFDLTAGTVTGWQTGTDTISSFEHIIGSGAMDTMLGSAGAETLDGGAGDDVLSGLGGKDVLIGGDGNDTLTGGPGRDVLTGGGGSDVFAFLHTSESAVAKPDKITDLGNDDTIDLSAIDADTTQKGDQAFHLVTAFDGHAGELTVSYDAATKLTTIAGDTNGDGVADFAIEAKGDHHDFANFVL